jgi:hypothetical protein
MCQLMATLVDGHLDGCMNGLDGEVIGSTDHLVGLSLLPFALQGPSFSNRGG